MIPSRKRGNTTVITIHYHYTCEPVDPRGIATYAYVIFKDEKRFKQGAGLASKALSDSACGKVALYSAILSALDELQPGDMESDEIRVMGRDGDDVQKSIAAGTENDPSARIFFLELQKEVSGAKRVTFETICHDKNVAVPVDVETFDAYIDKNPDIKEKYIDPAAATVEQRSRLREGRVVHPKHITISGADKLLRSF
jgi:hypothetical protein